MSKYTGSISRGKTAEKHNTRECYAPSRTPANIDRAKSPENVVLICRSLEDVYEERFGDAARAYSALQVEKGHPERQITDYLLKVRADKKLQAMYEFVVQVGNVDEHPPAEVACEVYTAWLDDFQARWGANFAVKQAIIHLDEATPHMHLEVVPVAESTRGLSVQNSMNKAVKQAGFADYKDMLAGWDACLTECMERQGIERVAGDRERQMGGVDIDTYRRSMAAKAEAEQVEQRLERLRQREERAAREFAQLDKTASPSIGDGLAAAAANRGLEREESELRDEVAALERRIEEAEQGVSAARAGRDGARERYDRARGAFGGALMRVMERLRELPRRVFERLGLAAQVAVEDMGVPVERDYRAMSLAERLAGARASADALNAQRHRPLHEKPRGGDAR